MPSRLFYYAPHYARDYAQSNFHSQIHFLSKLLFKILCADYALSLVFLCRRLCSALCTAGWYYARRQKTHIKARSQQQKEPTRKEKANNCEVRRRRGAAAQQSQCARYNLGLACSSQNLIRSRRLQKAVAERLEQACERRRIEAWRDTHRDNSNVVSDGEPTATDRLALPMCMMSCIIPGIIPGIMPCIMPCIMQTALKK